jgi:uncharacterized membrane protein YbhN (UPF0104 family)
MIIGGCTHAQPPRRADDNARISEGGGWPHYVVARAKAAARGVMVFRRAHLLLGVAVSAVALYLALRGVHWGEVGHAIGEADAWLIVAASLMFIVTTSIRAYRWRLLLYSVDSLRLWHLFGALNVGYFMNNILPLQVGEVGRAYLLSELSGISTTRSLSTIVVERVLDVLVLLLMLLVLAPFVPVPAGARVPAALLAAAFVVFASGLVLASRHRGPLPSLIERGIDLAPAPSRPKLRQMAENGVHGFAVLADPARGLAAAGVTAAAWLTVGVTMYLGMRAFHLHLGYEAAMLVVIATTFGFFFPSTPGAFGVYHAIVIATLTQVFDVDKNLAVSFALVVHLVVYLPPVLIGTGVLWVERRVWQRTSFFDKLAELRGGRRPAPAVD